MRLARLPRSISPLVLAGLALLATTAQAVNATDLINALLPGSDAAFDGQLITGEAKDFGELTLTLLSNQSHALSE